ncbi:MAG: membrane protein insertase YidC [Elusimicrobiaceae bacterium]|nr:membrane protein insertase YidC [Elusimicrobiaceae bacterium]
MNKNLVLAFTLSFAVYAGWLYWVEKKYPNAHKKPAVTAPAQAGANGKPQISPVAAPAAKNAPVKQVQPVSQEQQDMPVAYTSGKADFEFSHYGAAIKSCRYRGPVNTAQLIPNSNPGFFATMPGVYFNLAGQENNRFRFEAALAQGVGMTKTYAFSEEGLGELEISISNSLKTAVEVPDWGINFGPGIGTVESEEKENTKLWQTACAIHREGKKHAVVENIKSEEKTPKEPWVWAGIENRYFLAALIPQQWPYHSIKFSEQKIENTKTPSIEVTAPAMVINPGETKSWKFSFYFGPKDYRKLQLLGHELDRSVEFGFFTTLGKLAMKVLYFNHGFTGNYGWSIVILTLLVQLILMPFTIKSNKSMMEMKKIQPELQKLQEKYKKDPQRLNMEMLELYKKHKVNPLGGCLPMLFQIPVFFALFTALRNSWDLHGAPWIFWIHDMSAKDPFYVLPLIMGALMFFQQKMTMANDNNPQMAVLKWMPVIFTFMFLTFPSGLVLYWTTSSIVSFIQQIWLKKTMSA